MFKAKYMLTAVAIAVGSAALGTGPAAAQANSVTGTVNVTGDVAARCAFTTNNVDKFIPEMADTTGHLDPTTVTALTATLVGWCNGAASTISVESNPLLLTPSTTVPTGFTDRVDFNATATAHPDGGDVAVSDDSSTAGGSAASTVGVFSSNIDVTFTSASAGSNLLMAGTYKGSVVVTLTPAA